MNAAEQQIKDWHEAEMQQVFEEECRAKQQELILTAEAALGESDEH